MQNVVWEEAEGEVGGEIATALQTTTMKNKAKRMKWKILTLLLLFMCYVAVYTCGGCLYIVAPLISKELNYTQEQLTDVLTASTLARIIPKIVFGVAVDYVGGKKVLVFGCIGMTISCLALPLGSSLWWMTLSWSCVRIFGAATWPSIIKICSKWYKAKEIGIFMALISLSYLVGDSFAITYIGLFSYAGVGWEGLFFLSGCLLFLIGILILLILRGSPEAIGFNEVPADPDNRLGVLGNESKPNNWRELFIPIFTSFAFWLLAAYYSGLYFIRQVFFTFTVQYLIGEYGVTSNAAIFGLICFNSFGGVSTLEAGILTDKISSFKRNIIMAFYCLFLSLTLGLLCGLGYYEYLNFNTSVLLICFCGFFLVGPFSLPAGVLSIKFGGKKSCATVSGMLDSIGSLISLLSGPIGQAVSDRGNWPRLWALLAVLSLFSGILCILYAYIDRWEVRLLKSTPDLRSRSSSEITPLQVN